jgi:type I restriction enzyme S subunit
MCEHPKYGYTASAEDTGNAHFLRITDITDSGVKWATVPFCECPEDLIERYLLKSGDIVFARIGATTGKSYLITDPPRCVFASYLIRVRCKKGIDPNFLSKFFRSDAYWRQVDAQKDTNLKKGVNGSVLKTLRIPVPPLPEQRSIAAVLGVVQRAMEHQERLLALTAELKRVLLHELYSRGLRHEPQKQTDSGLIPESWDAIPLGTCCDILSGSMAYTDFLKAPPSTVEDSVNCMAVKVSDMNLSGNEDRFVTANASKRLPLALASKKLLPARTLVFPKRGAAIATNKKRMTTTWTVLDPNLIGVRCHARVDPQFLYHWSQTFDLRRITEPGPTPQLNKKNLVPILIPLPRSTEEQREIAETLDSADRKFDLHRRKHAMLSALFRTLLHQLMTAHIRVRDLDLGKSESAIAA